MEIVLVVAVVVAAWVHGYRSGRRSASVVTLSERDLRRALKARRA